MKYRQKALSEYESKLVTNSAGIPIANEYRAKTREEAVEQCKKIGFPVVLKGSSHTLTHKTESGMVKLNLSSEVEVIKAYDEITNSSSELDGVLVQEMIRGDREFVIGLSRDPNFGPCVMFGLGGIFTEVIKDVTFRIAPITETDAMEMIDELKTNQLLDEFRGSPAVDRDILVKALVGIGDLGDRYDEIAEIDINPLIVSGNKPVAVDALVILTDSK